MTRFKHSRIFLIPSAKREEVNKSLEREYGPDSFSVPLEKDGKIISYICSAQCDEGMLKDFQAAVSKARGKEKKETGFNRLEKVLKDEALTLFSLQK